MSNLFDMHCDCVKYNNNFLNLHQQKNIRLRMYPIYKTTQLKNKPYPAIVRVVQSQIAKGTSRHLKNIIKLVQHIIIYVKEASWLSVYSEKSG